MLLDQNEIPAKMIPTGLENWLNYLLYYAPNSIDRELDKRGQRKLDESNLKVKVLPGPGVQRSDKSLSIWQVWVKPI